MTDLDFPAYLLMLILKGVLWVLELWTDVIFGLSFTCGNRQERKRAEEDFEHSAQVVKVLWKAHPVPITTHDFTNFLFRHEAYVHPR